MAVNGVCVACVIVNTTPAHPLTAIHMVLFINVYYYCCASIGSAVSGPRVGAGEGSVQEEGADGGGSRGRGRVFRRGREEEEGGGRAPGDGECLMGRWDHLAMRVRGGGVGYMGVKRRCWCWRMLDGEMGWYFVCFCLCFWLVWFVLCCVVWFF